jgi:phosphatidylserine decarboxylase
MSEATERIARLAPQPLPANITSVQPGGGFCYRLELAWGRLRRRYLKRFRPGYVRRMAELRTGDATGAPHEIIDPRDLKYFRNVCHCGWDAADDPFRWRDRIGLARWGFVEIVVFGLPLLAIVIALALMPAWYLAFIPGVVLAWLFSFFRDPARRIPTEAGLVVSPADGTVVEVARLERDEFLDGPAVRIGIFLSVFNVHINRAPVAARVIGLRYSPGKFLNALKSASAHENEALWIGLEEESPPHRRLVVRQIAGAIARRIVCDLRPGETLDRGQKFGMIKFGSRTELVLPADESLEVLAAVGDKVHGGVTILGRFTHPAHFTQPGGPSP